MAKKAARKQTLKASTRTPAKSPVHAAGSMTLVDRLDTLLHTMRCIAQREDELCTLLHDARSADGLTPGLAQELRAVLNDLPAEEYAWELHAVEMALNASDDRLQSAA